VGADGYEIGPGLRIIVSLQPDGTAVMDGGVVLVLGDVGHDGPRGDALTEDWVGAGSKPALSCGPNPRAGLEPIFVFSSRIYCIPVFTVDIGTVKFDSRTVIPLMGKKSPDIST
jgi:hypothetical protein